MCSHRYFLQHSVLNWIYFPIPVCYNISRGNLWSPPALLLGRYRYVSTKFFVGTLILNNVCVKHFLIQSVFFAMYSPKVNPLSHSSTIGAAHTSETNCLKHAAWNMKYLYDATNQYMWRSLEKGAALLVRLFWIYVANHVVDSLTINLSPWDPF